MHEHLKKIHEGMKGVASNLEKILSENISKMSKEDADNFASLLKDQKIKDIVKEATDKIKDFNKK